MLHLLPSALAVYLLVAGRTCAQNNNPDATVQDSWVFPARPDNSSTVYDGASYAVQWRTNLTTATWIFANYCPDCDPTNVDLWATGGLSDSIVHQVKTGINTKTTLAFQWNVNIPDGDISSTGIWILRFVPSGTSPGTGISNIASPRFYIRSASSNPNSTSSTTTTTSAPTSTTSAPATTSTTAHKDGLSTGAKAGIAVGVILGIALIVALIGVFVIRKRKSKQEQPPSSPAAAEPANRLNGFGAAGVAPPEYDAGKIAYTDAPAGQETKQKSHAGMADAQSPQELRSSPITGPGGHGPFELEHVQPMSELDAASSREPPRLELPTEVTRNT